MNLLNICCLVLVELCFISLFPDDPETESSTEMDVHDDRIESDQSELQTTDNSNLSNVDISDLMENIRVNRQYLHHPKPWIDVFLNAALVLVISVAIGMGIGHNLGMMLKTYLIFYMAVSKN